jgi:chemotaxis protein MotB
MSRRRFQPDEGGGLPLWVLTFSDMITLLLTFFVLLQAFAKEQDAVLFQEGRESFKEAIGTIRLPIWRWTRPPIRRNWYIRRYSDEPGAEKNPPLLDAEEERIQRIFQRLKECIESQSAKMDQTPSRVEVTPVRFPSGAVRLDRQARAYLDDLAVDLQGNVPAKGSVVYLVGLAPDQQPSQKQWVLSTLRAQQAEDYLRGRLGGGWRLVSWGGGRSFGRFPEGTYLGLVVMGETHGG